MLLTSVAGYFGLVAGIGVLELINWMGVKGDFFQNPEVDLAVAAYAVLTLIAAGTFAGYIPAQKAARVNPIAALSDE